MMIVSDNQRMWFEMTDQKLADIFFGRKLRELCGKRNDHQTVNSQGCEQFDFFIHCIDQPVTGSCIYNGTRVRIKSYDDRFAIHLCRLFFHSGNDLLMSRMNAIKCSNGEYGISKR